MTDASQSPKKFAEDGLSEEERRMLGALGAKPAAGAASPAANPASAVGEDEELVLRQAKEESRRLTQVALERMFDRSGKPSEPTAGFEALLSQEAAAAEKPAATPQPRGALAKAVDSALDLVNAPFRWLPHSFRLGLGLCGALLLITLLLVMIFRALGS